MDRQDGEFEGFLKQFKLREARVVLETRAPGRKPHGWWLAAAAAVAVVITLLLVSRRVQPIAVLEGATGKRIESGETVRSDDRSGALLTLSDKSRVEMRAQSEVFLERAADGIRLHLNRGSVIVNAAEQGAGHLYVQTKDCTVSVVGTVFLVESADTGSRVAVIQGEVHVQQGATLKKLQPGQQLATAPAMPVIPVTEEIAWSRNVAAHLVLLKLESGPVQAPASAAALQFEAASIKSGTVPGPRILFCRGTDMSWGRPLPAEFVAPKGRCVANGVSLMWLISGAYFVPEENIYGGPSWIHSRDASFQLDAKAEDGSNPTTGQLRQMLQNLLAERFKLQLHRESRDSQGYQLVIGKGGHKLRLSSSDERGVFSRGHGVYEMKSQPISSLVDLLTPFLRRPVLDKTSLTGLYDFSLTVTNAGSKKGSSTTPGGGPEFDPPIPSAVQDQLGLRLESQKVPVDVIVVDYAEKPSEN